MLFLSIPGTRLQRRLYHGFGLAGSIRITRFASKGKMDNWEFRHRPSPQTNKSHYSLPVNRKQWDQACFFKRGLRWRLAASRVWRWWVWSMSDFFGARAAVEWHSLHGPRWLRGKLPNGIHGFWGFWGCSLFSFCINPARFLEVFYRGHPDRTWAQNLVLTSNMCLFSPFGIVISHDMSWPYFSEGSKPANRNPWLLPRYFRNVGLWAAVGFFCGIGVCAKGIGHRPLKVPEVSLRQNWTLKNPCTPHTQNP